MYADGVVPGLLRHVGAADLARTSSMVRRLYPGCEIEPREGTEPWECLSSPKGTAHAASWPGGGCRDDRHPGIRARGGQDRVADPCQGREPNSGWVLGSAGAL
ncbi:DUF6928 family protein [Streptomyces sp. NPDC001604]|uniref:DUF6928 family protein n=1 Tax=Streptomyces sp. NPDC001604 TaxID=3364593 RepID=UPI003691A050